MIIILISIFLSILLISLHLIDKRLNKLNDKIDIIHDSLYLRIENLRSSVINLRMDLDTYKKIWKTQMRPNTNMMDAQNIKDTSNATD